MEPSELRALRLQYPLRKQSFYYFKDKYALQLLKWYIGQEMTIGELRSSPMARFLQKPLMSHILASASNGVLTPGLLDAYWPENTLVFTLSLGAWGEYSKGRKDDYWQTTRSGKSLVLHVNFTNEHNTRFQRLMKPNNNFMYTAHPYKAGKYTMGWARIDLDMQTGEALIEEIQQDWLRNAQHTLKAALHPYEPMHKACSAWQFYSNQRNREQASAYRAVVEQYAAVWDEAILSAALWLLKEHLGISKVWYHTYEAGCKLKCCTPPRSLYTKLPKRFGFKQTTQSPQFLLNDRYFSKYLKKEKAVAWHFLQV